MRRVGLLALTAVAIAGCANSPPLVDRVSDGRVQGDASRVSIEGGRLNALPLAIAHCARYGRAAQWGHPDGDRSVYTCVVRP